MNEFRHVDACEYADAYRRAVESTSQDAIVELLQDLDGRMVRIEGEGQPIPSYLLAAYRGYENALDMVRSGIVPNTVKLSDAATS